MSGYEIGTWAEIPSPYVMDILSKSGFDFTIIDMEHGVIDFETAQNMIFATRANGKSAYIRVPEIKESWVLRCLDMGADGIIFPQVSCREDAEKAVRLSKFRPWGDRGFNPYTAFGNYGKVGGNFLQQENERIKLGIILESKAGFDNIDDILDVKDIGIIYIGQYDLSVSLGIPGETDNPAILDLMNLAVEKIKHAGKKAGCMVHSTQECREIIKQGFQFIVYKVDTGILSEAVRVFVKDVRQ